MSAPANTETKVEAGYSADALHIAFLLTQSLDSPSGLGRFGPLARSLARRGHRVEIYALHPNFSREYGQPYDQDGVRVQYVAPMHVRKEGSKKPYYSPAGLIKVAAGATYHLTFAALRSRAAILHICKPHPMNGVAGLAGAWLRNKTLWVDCDDYEAGSNLFGGGWQKKIVAGFERQIPRQAAAVTTHSQFMRGKLAEWGVEPKKIAYIPNGVEPQRFQNVNGEQIQRLRGQLGLDGKKVVAYIGSLSLASHPVDLLLQAFAGLPPTQPPAVLLIVGGGEDYERLQGEAAAMGLGRNVIFTGRIQPDEVGTYYHLANVSVDPVHDDEAARGRSPLKMFESWLCGVPFVTADVGDRRFLMGDPPAGILTRADDPQALAGGILQMLQDPIKSAELSALGRKHVQNFFWDKLAQTLEQHYRTLPGGTA